tara:strand:+ start:215 stop:328 length:114 start_codon:yes stop_codon:yes gene_type:complete
VAVVEALTETTLVAVVALADTGLLLEPLAVEAVLKHN